MAIKTKSVQFIGTMLLLLPAALCSAAAHVASERSVSEVSLSEGWTADGLPVSLPHTWNAVDAADGRVLSAPQRVLDNVGVVGHEGALRNHA